MRVRYRAFESSRIWWLTVAVAVSLFALMTALSFGGSSQKKVPNVTIDTEKSDTMSENSGSRELATFGAGCFWGVEETFRQIKGVTSTAVGYMGGNVDEPTYKQVCADTTGHAEVVQIEFDPDIVSYDQLLEVFWKVHDPTQVNRQGPDVGAQYRTAIFFHSDEQQAAASKAIETLTTAGTYSQPIATEVTPAATFWRAEEYHQQYLHKRGLPACNLY